MLVQHREVQCTEGHWHMTHFSKQANELDFSFPHDIHKGIAMQV